MKKMSVFLLLIISFLILISCNSKTETPPPHSNIIAETPLVEPEKPAPEQSWKELLLSQK